MFRALVAVIAATGTLSMGCGGPAWPKGAVNAGAVAAPPVGTVDVLPLDLQLWAEHGYDVNLEQVASTADSSIMNTAIEALNKRHYSVGVVMDGNGEYPGGTALPREDLLATLDALGRYGTSAAQHPGELPVPYLPARLGDATGADATLYIGGWGYVAAPRKSTGEKVAEGIMIGLLVLAVVVVVAAAVSGKGGHGHGGGFHGGHGGGSHWSGGAWHGVRAGGQAIHLAADMVDAFGRTAANVALADTQWADDPALPHGGPSQMYLEMTLVDNHTGLALWHAHQTFPASAASSADAARAVRTVLATLPSQLPPGAH